nr:unnamed protein product [Callosobruchus chinensis]
MSKTKAELKKTSPTKTTGGKTALKKQAQNQKQAASAKSTTDSVKDVYAYDSGSNASSNRSRGPFIHIRGPRDSPISVSVVNTPISEEDGDRRPAKAKKYHDDSEYRHKTRDTSWICAFCKRGPHASDLNGPTLEGPAMGDLFGPYFISSQCPEFERRLDDPFDSQFKSKKVARALDEQQAQFRAGKKMKRKHSDVDRMSESETDMYLGIHETTSMPSTSKGGPASSSSTEPSYEVWAHEDCIVWSPGTYLVGARVVGLEEAVWQACGVPCSLCKLRGATVCCLRRGCDQRTHVPCARRLDWKMDEEGGFKAWCVEHAT